MGMQRVVDTLPDRFFRVLADHVADVAYLAGPDRRIAWVAPTVEGCLGWTPDELVGRSMSDLIHPDDVPRIAMQREKLYGGRSIGDVEHGVTLRLLHKDGGYHWFSGRGVPLLGDDGEPIGIAAGLRKVDDLVEERERAQAGEERVRAVLDGMLDPHMVLEGVRDDSGEIADVRFVWLNPQASHVLGVTADDVLGMRLLQWRPAIGDTEIWKAGMAALRTGEPVVLDGYSFPDAVMPGGRVYDIRGVPLGQSLSWVFRDVTARHQVNKRIAESERRFRLLAENTSDLVLTVRPDGCIDWASPAAQVALGVPGDSLIARAFADLVHPDDRQALEEAAGAEVRLGCADGWRWVRMSRRVLVGDGSTTVYTAQDIRAEMDTRAQLAHELGHDPLTGLANRTATLARLRDLLRARGRREGLALLAIGVDDLRSVNEAFTYTAGDRVLTQIGRRLLAFAESSDDVSRVGDNEFTLIVHDVPDPTSLADLASSLRAELPSAVTIDGHLIPVTVSIGIATPENQRALDLLRDATSALHHARAKGGNRWEYLDSAVTQTARQRLIIRSGIHEALATEQIRPWFQPVVSLADGRQTGYEALARWVRDDVVVLPPDFIPVAESTDLIVSLDRHMMRQSLAAVAALDWPAQLGINVSAQTLSEPNFADHVQDELERSG